MLQRIVKNPDRKLNVLFVCPTRDWSTRERQVLRDIRFAIEHGHQCLVYCLKDGPLALNLKLTKLNLEIIYHRGKVATHFLRWHKLMFFMSLFKKRHIHLVHCYSQSFLWPLCFFLGRFPLIPLVFTPGVDKEKVFHKIWYRPLIARIDQIFGLDQNYIDDLSISFGVPVRKIKRKGYGLRQEFNAGPHSVESGTDLPGCSFYVGIAFPPHWEKWDQLANYFHLATSLQNVENGKGIKLIFYREGGWSKFVLGEKVLEKMAELKISSYIDLVDLAAGECPLVSSDGKLGLWLGVGEEVLEDRVILALMKGIPILAPRSVASSFLLQTLGDVGELFQRGNVKQMRDKCLKIKVGAMGYRGSVLSAYKELAATHGELESQNNLLDSYHALISRRERLFLRRPL